MITYQGGGAPSSPINLVTAAGSPVIQSFLTATDTVPAFRILGTGELDWGPGGASPIDTNLVWSSSLPTTGAHGLFLQAQGGGNQRDFVAGQNLAATTGRLQAHTAGQGLLVGTGSNAKAGTTGAMTTGAVTVANTAVTASSMIFLARAPGGTNPGAWYVSAQTAGTSFVATSTNASDTGTGYYLIVEPG